MNKARFVLILTLALLPGAALWATLSQAAPGAAHLVGGAPAVVAYQGEVRESGAPYNGDGYFKFAVVNASGDTAYWSNDGTSTGGGEPTAAVQLAVSEGLFSVLLGDTTLGGMTQDLTADVFNQPDRYLRVWFSASAGGPFGQLTPDTRVAAVPYALQAQEAVNADTVDGLHASELQTHYQNLVIVAQSGGDYTSVQAAIDSVADAATDNPYLVWVAPGVYSETVTMKPYVHLQGAGQGATFITSTASNSAWPPSQATLILASDASLRDLTVANDGAGNFNTALLATGGMTRTLVSDVTARALGGDGLRNYAIVLSGDGTGVRLQQVTALAENASGNNYGLLNRFGAMTVLHGGSFIARGGTVALGITSVGSDTSLEAHSISTLGEHGSADNYGLFNVGGSAATLHGGSFTGRGGVNPFGIANNDNGTTLEAEGDDALGEHGSGENYGFGNWMTATATLRGGSFTGRGGAIAYGITNGAIDTTLAAQSVTALAENGSDANHGLFNFAGAAATVHGGSFTGISGTNAYGISNLDDGTTLEVKSVSARGKDGSGTNYGLYYTSDELTTADSSQFSGSSNGLYQVSGTIRLGVSRLAGGATRTGGTLTCFQVYDGSYAAYACP